MPDTSHPPYGVYQPRVLNRWLDVNSQNGPIRRTSTYVTIPAFSITSVWKGYSDLVAYFEYIATKNFSLTALPLVVDETVTLCISYVTTNVDGDPTTIRYSLNRSPYDVIFFDLPEYNGQPIGKNFKIEVWNTYWPESSPKIGKDAVFAGVALYTSVLNSVDYRYGLDTALAISSAKATYGYLIEFNAPQPLQDINGADMHDINGNAIEPPDPTATLYNYTTPEQDRGLVPSTI